jgi:hypothetical protein
MATQTIVANRIIRGKKGEVHFVLSPKTDAAACQVGGTIDDDGNLKDVHCVNVSCQGKQCNLHEEPDENDPEQTHYYCTCD